MYKFIFFLKDNKNIVITTKDNNIPIDEYIKKIADVMASSEISIFKTSSDIIILKATDLISVHIVLNTSSEIIKDDIKNTLLEEPNLQSIVPEIDLDEIGNKNTDCDDIEDFSNSVDDIINKDKIKTEHREPEEEIDENDTNI